MAASVVTHAAQGSGGPLGHPLCYNAEPVRDYLANDGYTKDGRLRTVRIPWPFSRDCASWRADPSTDPVPLAEGWLCAGCKHYPAELVKLALPRRADRVTRPPCPSSSGSG